MLTCPSESETFKSFTSESGSSESVLLVSLQEILFFAITFFITSRWQNYQKKVVAKSCIYEDYILLTNRLMYLGDRSYN
jgi:hypothetical protein